MDTRAARPAVLIAADDEPMRYTRVRTLQPHFRTFEARNGVEALAMSRRDAPDLILADVRMPQMDGVALCEAIRADPALSRIPVLLVSALGRDRDPVTTALEAGADDYLTEPVPPELLVAKLRVLLRRRFLETELATANDRLSREAAHREAEFRAIFESAIDGVFIVNDSGRYVDVNAAGCALLAGTRDQIVGRPPSDFVLLDVDWKTGIEKLHRTGNMTGLVRMRRIDGVEIDAEFAVRANFVPGRHLSFVRDVTERRQLEEQLRQSQKMEAIGRLAGGIAHDFNNLLTIILAASEMVAENVPEGSAAWRHSQEALDAAHRAAGLTNQLLAFSRRQVLRPVELDLNLTVADMSAMLQRVLGEHITLKVRPEPALPPARVDLGQIGQVILNLAVNARDAMPRGGTLFIETKRVTLSPGYAQRHVGVTPGRYVLLAVSDTGSGMDEDTRRRVFEPFFTTKELGKGTGLGLSTVYGIVKQSGGNIWVYSELGHGTTFKIYLPEAGERAPERAALVAISDRMPRGRASVLIVEDEPGVRSVASRALERCGYEVATASSGEDALAWWEDGVSVDLLITDVVMPGISGSELVARLRAMRPELRVLYTSGYTEDAVVHHGVASGAHFLSKPFTPADLAQKVRDVLAAPPDAVV